MAARLPVEDDFDSDFVSTWLERDVFAPKLDSTSQYTPEQAMCMESISKPRPSPIYKEKQHEEYWSFLKSVPDVPQDACPPPPTRCPSLMSGGTLSSRNSSTRSIRSSVWETISLRNSIPIPKDANINTRTSHFEGQLAETCPVKSCERHRKAFTKAGDKKRHVMTHFNRALLCGFCETSTVAFTQASDRATLFMTHLIKHHAVKEPGSGPGVGVQHTSKSGTGNHVANCSVCQEPFTAQVMYEHLPGCILREITRNAEASARTEQGAAVDEFKKLKDKPESVIYLADPARADIVLVMDQDLRGMDRPAGIVESECGDIAELTMSSRCLSLTSSRAMESSEEETDWSENVTSRESSPGVSQVPRRLSPTKRRVVDTIMQEFHDIFYQNLRKHTAAGSSSSSSSGGAGGWSSNTSTYSSASFVSRKRSLSGGGSTPPNDDDDSNKRRRPYSKAEGKQPVSDLRFACPYYKRNPGRHQIFTSCRDPGFTTVARLKEHLYRRHLLPPQCHRCCTTFSNDTLLRDHQRDATVCEIREQLPLEGFDKDQERKLKSKKRSLVSQSEEDKWKTAYRILFPDDDEVDMPGPYIEYQHCATGNSAPSNTTRFQDFSRLELPRLVRRTLETIVEQEAQPLEDKLKERLVDIVKECQTQLESMFQVATGVLNDTPTIPPESLKEVDEQQPCFARVEDFEPFPIQTRTHLSTTSTSHLSPSPNHDFTWTQENLPMPSIHESESSIPTNTHIETSEYLDLGTYPDLFADTPSTAMPTASWSFSDHFPEMSNAEFGAMDFGNDLLNGSGFRM